VFDKISSVSPDKESLGPNKASNYEQLVSEIKASSIWLAKLIGVFGLSETPPPKS
jgi:hypothetical protein